MIDILTLAAITVGLPYLLISMWVLFHYQRSTGKPPPSMQLWAFHSELKTDYPRASKAARVLGILLLIFGLPCLFSLLFIG